MRSETPEPPKSPPPQDKKKDEVKPTSVEDLIHFNGELVEQLFSSKPWQEIAFPLIQESIAGVSGRLTNGRYHHGTLTRDWTANTSLFVAGYQKALMDFYNNLQDFVSAKDKQLASKAKSKADKAAPLYNPFMEEDSDN